MFWRPDYLTAASSPDSFIHKDPDVAVVGCPSPQAIALLPVGAENSNLPQGILSSGLYLKDKVKGNRPDGWADTLMEQ